MCHCPIGQLFSLRARRKMSSGRKICTLGKRIMFHKVSQVTILLCEAFLYFLLRTAAFYSHHLETIFETRKNERRSSWEKFSPGILVTFMMKRITRKIVSTSYLSVDIKRFDSFFLSQNFRDSAFQRKICAVSLTLQTSPLKDVR